VGTRWVGYQSSAPDSEAEYSMEIVDGRGLLIFERGSRNLFGAIKGTKATGLRPRSIPSLSPSVVFIGLFRFCSISSLGTR
jgi:hypothetical protein